jgi:hypothetical protein
MDNPILYKACSTIHFSHVQDLDQKYSTDQSNIQFFIVTYFYSFHSFYFFIYFHFLRPLFISLFLKFLSFLIPSTDCVNCLHFQWHIQNCTHISDTVEVNQFQCVTVMFLTHTFQRAHYRIQPHAKEIINIELYISSEFLFLAFPIRMLSSFNLKYIISH